MIVTLTNDETGAVQYVKASERSAIHLIHILKAVEGAKSMDGDCSVQVLLPLKQGGKYLRIGITDNDVASDPFSIWWDRYGAR